MPINRPVDSVVQGWFGSAAELTFSCLVSPSELFSVVKQEVGQHLRHILCSSRSRKFEPIYHLPAALLSVSHFRMGKQKEDQQAETETETELLRSQDYSWCYPSPHTNFDRQPKHPLFVKTIFLIGCTIVEWSGRLTDLE